MKSKVRAIDVLRWLGAVAVVSLTTFIAAGHPATASAADATCGQAVIQDWAADGVVDQAHATECYASALRELPEDVRLYSSASSDILAARARAGLRGNSNRSLQSAGAASTTRVSDSGGGPFSVTTLAAAAAAVSAAASAILVRRRRRGGRTKLRA